MLTIWDFLALAFIALAAVAAITHAIGEAARKLTVKPKDVSFDVMTARVAATGWHFALEESVIAFGTQTISPTSNVRS